MTFTTRFAPSPTGYLHLGHAYSALSAWQAAQCERGEFLLRIEDIDTTRCKPEFEAAILDDLTWLGLDWALPVRRQSEHFADHAKTLDTLIENDLVYRCFKTRKEIAADIARAPHDLALGAKRAIYSGPITAMSPDEEAERLETGEDFAWRLSVTRCRDFLDGGFDHLTFVEDGEGPHGEHGTIFARPDLLGDVIVARKDVGTSYHVAVAHDDALQGVSHIIRGTDLFAATHLHTLLQAIMGWPKPVYRHHRLITDRHGKRFAKRNKSVTLRALREAGETPHTIRRRIGLDGDTS